MTDQANLAERFSRQYTAAIADVLDQRGLQNQIMNSEIQGLGDEERISGPAFPCKGAPATELESDDWEMRKAYLDDIPAGSIAVVDSSGDQVAAHWGELMSSGAIGRGCRGVVIDGGTRDVSLIQELGFPVFARYRSPASSIRRWRMSGYDHPVYCGGVLVRPGDFVVGDADGVVVIPQEMTIEVLETVEGLTQVETAMREEILSGVRFSEAWDRYQVG